MYFRCAPILLFSLFLSILPAYSEFKELFNDVTEGQDSGYAGFSTPAVGNLDGDTSNGDEIVVGQTNGSVVAVNAQGGKLWQTYLPSSQCQFKRNLHKLYSSPTIGDLNGDGKLEVVTGYGTIGIRGCDGGVVALNGATGEILWTFSLLKFSKSEKFWAIWHGVYGKPAVADTDGDGKMEIGFGSFDRNVYLLNYDGSVRWYYMAADTVWSSPTFADINGDGILEMLIGTDIYGNSKLKPITKSGGYLYAFKTKSNPSKKYYFRNSKAYYWVRYFDQAVYSTPVVAEMIKENGGKEVAIGSGCFYPERKADKNGKQISILSLKTGKILRKLQTINCFPSKVATQDINGDGEAEVFAAVAHPSIYNGNGNSRLVSYDVQNNTKLWEIIPTYRNRPDANLGYFKSPVVADVKGDGNYTVFLSVANAIGAYSAVDGHEVSCEMRDCRNSSDQLTGTSNYIFSTPVVADMNKDGVMELIVGGRKSGSSGIYGWTF